MSESSSSSSSPTEEIVRLIKRISAYVTFKMSTSLRNLVSFSISHSLCNRIWNLTPVRVPTRAGLI